VSLFGQNVYIPDANFKAYLVGNSEINTNGDTEIQVSEASVFNGTIDCYNIDISDLSGIEAFTSLVNLQFWGSNLSYLDLSQNVALESLGLGISSSQNKLDLSQCINLQNIWMECVPFECINVQNTNLNEFYICSSDPICIQVDDEQNTSYLTDDSGNVTVSESCECFAPNTYVPDDALEQHLITYGYDDVMDDSVRTENLNNIQSLLFMDGDPMVLDWTGTEDFIIHGSIQFYNYLCPVIDLSLAQTSFTNELGAGSNLRFQILNITQEIKLPKVPKGNTIQIIDCPLLTNVEIHDTTALLGDVVLQDCINLPSLDLSMIEPYGNTSIDVSINIAHSLCCLNLKNGFPYNWGDVSIITFGSVSNCILDCIQVDDISFASNSGWTVFNQDFINQTPGIYDGWSTDCGNDCSSTSSLNELSTSKNLIQILDVMGCETSFKANTPLIYVYDDGSIEKVFSVEY